RMVGRIKYTRREFLRVPAAARIAETIISLGDQLVVGERVSRITASDDNLLLHRFAVGQLYFYYDPARKRRRIGFLFGHLRKKRLYRGTHHGRVIESRQLDLAV